MKPNYCSNCQYDTCAKLSCFDCLWFKNEKGNMALSNFKPKDNPMTKAIDWNKPVETEDGDIVRVLATDLPSQEYPVAVVINSLLYSYSMDGMQWRSGSSYGKQQLRNAPTRVTRWVNIFRFPSGNYDIVARLFLSKDDALVAADWDNHVAAVKIEWEE